MRRLLATVMVVAPVTAPAQAAVAAPRWHELAHASESGSFLVVGVTAHARRPAALAVRVTTAPRGRVGGNTLVRCDGRTRHGHVHGATPLVRALLLPAAHPQDCSVVVNVSYAARGRVTVTVLGR